MKYTATRPGAPVLTISPTRPVIGQPFAKGPVKLNDEELKAVATANLDRTIRWNLCDFGKCVPGEPDPESRPRSDGEIVDSVVESVTADLAYNENLTLGIRALGGLSVLPSIILQRIPAVRAKEAARASSPGGMVARG